MPYTYIISNPIAAYPIHCSLQRIGKPVSLVIAAGIRSESFWPEESVVSHLAFYLVQTVDWTAD